MRILFRTRGNPRQGMGDLHGCLALAREFERVGWLVAVMAEPDVEATAFLHTEHLLHYPAKGGAHDIAVVRYYAPRCLVVNMLRSEYDYLKCLKEAAGMLVTIDDDGPAALLADLRINPLYPIGDALIEPDYIPLKSDVRVHRLRPREWRSKVKRVIVSLGGSDTYGFTPLVLEGLAFLSREVEIEIIIGPAFRHEAELALSVSRYDVHRVQIHKDVSDLSRHLFEADLVVCGGGLTLFEAACVGTPAVVIGGEAFEVATAQRLERMGFGICVGFGGDCTAALIGKAVAYLMDPRRRETMGRRGKQLVDGYGAEKVTKYILHMMNTMVSRQRFVRKGERR